MTEADILWALSRILIGGFFGFAIMSVIILLWGGKLFRWLDDRFKSQYERKK